MSTDRARWLAVAAATLLTAALLDVPASSAGDAEEAPGRELLELAAAAAEAGETKRALKTYERAAGSPELRLEALLGVARIQSRLGKREKALAAAGEALSAAAGDPALEARVHDTIGLIEADEALRLLIEIEHLSERPGKKKPTWGERVREHQALAEAAFRRALELSGGDAREAWRNLVDLLASMGRFGEARDELVAFFEHDAGGHAFAAETLAHLECVGDYADLGELTEPPREGVSRPVKLFHPSPRLAAVEADAAGTGQARVAGVVDVEGRFRCVRILNAEQLTPELRALFLATVGTWRFQPASRDGERLAAFYSDTVELLDRP